MEAFQSEDVEVSESFDSVELDGEFQRLELEHHELHNAYRGPPNKKRKINTELGLLKQITSKLYTILGAQAVSDLTGLAQIAEYAILWIPHL